MAWIGNYVISLNREVGELKQQVQAMEKANDLSAAAATAAEERVQRQIERLEDRLERRDDRTVAPTRDGQPGQKK
jgi:hypothetical protein